MKKLSLCLMLIALSGCANFLDKVGSADTKAKNAASFFAQGDLSNAQTFANIALEKNPNQEVALLVAALSAEGSQNFNQAKAYYERIIILNPSSTTSLTSIDLSPVKIVDVANKRLRALNIKNSQVVLEDYQGDKVFNIKASVADSQNKSALEQALFAKEAKDVNNTKANAEANVKAVEVLFDEDEKNKISRFLILKELAEEDLITKEEFLQARTTNLGAILPLTNQAPAYGLGKPVPSADAIVERIAILRDGVEDQSITSKEFLAERNAIIKALLPTKPRVRADKKKPAKDILTAAKNLRKLEVLSELNLITQKEKQREIKAIETFLGMNQQPKVIEKIVKVPAAPAPQKEPVAEQKTEEKQSNPTEVTDVVIEDISNAIEQSMATTPEVSNPF